MERLRKTPWIWSAIASTAYWAWVSRPHRLEMGSLTWLLAGAAQLSAFSIATTLLFTRLTGIKTHTWQRAAVVGTLGFAASMGILRMIYPSHRLPCETGIAALCIT